MRTQYPWHSSAVGSSLPKGTYLPAQAASSGVSPDGSHSTSVPVEIETSLSEGARVRAEPFGGSTAWTTNEPAANHSQTSRTALPHLRAARDIRSHESTTILRY